MKTGSVSLRLVYGVCGIGLGHSLRQLPLLESYIQQNSKMCVFAYGQSFEFFKKRFQAIESVIVEEVAVPFYAGNEKGLDFKASASHRVNQDTDFLGINCKAMERAVSFIGTPDLVISDYEPVAAQYAYAYNAPLVTIDQQSKYLCKSVWPELSGFHCVDEVMRLRMLFPKAQKRIATSFFKLEVDSTVPEQVELHGPVIRNEVLQLSGQEQSIRQDLILVYLSSQQEASQSMEELLEVFAAFSNWRFDIYVSEKSTELQESVPRHIQLRRHGDNRYLESLTTCAAIISTAGHTLLSEAMSLEKPVMAMPLAVYEQHMNASILESHGFGMSVQEVTRSNLKDFLSYIPDGRRAINEDSSILFKEVGQLSILNTLSLLSDSL